MKVRTLGNSGLKVSELCFGTMTFGGSGYWSGIGKQTQKDADELVGIALDGGINFFDTADIYSWGISETLLGKALGSRRKDIILATKVRGRMSDDLNGVGLSRHHILNGCDASLKRLGTDYIDLYQVHNWDHVTALEETMQALSDLVRWGKVRYIGCSNFTGWQLMKAMAVSEKLNLAKFITIQSYYSLMNRELEFEIVPACLDQDLGILPWSPLAGGFLTGKYKRGQKRPGNARRSNVDGNFLQFDEEKGFGIIDELEVISNSHNASISQTALNYLLRKQAVSSLVIGARTPDQLKDLLKTTDWEMTEEEVKRLDEISKPPRIYPYWMQDFMRNER
ncbi:MAG: aldo/keto reductase [Ignavibacteriales bacterium]|nr:aldo/keto reductase [Ignavibacteriales bacterium]